MSYDKSIGGYFGLELNDNNNLYHNDAISLNLGRNAFEFILLYLKVKEIYIPLYTCDVILGKLKKNNIKYFFYNLDGNLNPIFHNIDKDKFILYTNYFGLKSDEVKSITTKYSKVIIDNSQAFYDFPESKVPTFYSARKFFGVPDGSFVYCKSNSKAIKQLDEDKSGDRIKHLIGRIEEGAESYYNEYMKNELDLDNITLKKMSKFTCSLLKNIDYKIILNKRVNNFKYLHKYLNKINLMSDLIDGSNYLCPMTYPLKLQNGKFVRQELIKRKIYTPQYWPSVLDIVNKDSIEHDTVENIVHLPIDQRYSKVEMKQIILNLNSILNK